jgi:hypothetical protein
MGHHEHHHPGIHPHGGRGNGHDLHPLS